VAAELARELGVQLVTARAAIELAVEQSHLTHRQLVDRGARLESECPGKWLAKALQRIAGTASVVVDSVRTRAQLAAVERWRPHLLSVFLEAPTELRRQRFRARATAGEMDFDELGATAVELEAQMLGPVCDVVFDSAKLSSVEIVETIVLELGARG
jgi:hypothetical protein